MENPKHAPKEALHWVSTRKLSLVMVLAMLCSTLSCSAEEQKSFNDPNRPHGAFITLGIRG